MKPIPSPRGYPIIGNALEIIGHDVLLDPLERAADQYGDIFKLNIAGNTIIFVASAELGAELLDEKRFIKEPPPALQQKKGPKGLFAAKGDDPDWGQAHRILMPAMGPLKIEDTFQDMRDICNQLVLKWARTPESRIFITDDFTRLTLDTIALCTMEFRFNSFYQDAMHPFVDAMTYVLLQNNVRATRPKFVTAMRVAANKKYEECQAQMNDVGWEIINKRKANPVDKNDLLNCMIHGKDPKTGQPMRDELVIAQMINFLVAGHETTSGMLSFTIYELLKNGRTYLKAQQEVDEVVGSGQLQPSHLKKFKYLNACLRESIRLHPTAPVITKKINPELVKTGQAVILGGEYKIEPTDRIMFILTKAQTDPRVYGDDAMEFKPERMFDEKFDELHAGAWKPFGNGSRSCIGRPFAWQESLLVLATILQHFDLRLDDPSYNLKLKQALTIKPKDLYIRASLRHGVDATSLARNLDVSGQQVNGVHEHGPIAVQSQKAKKMQIFYGSNTGTCQAFAQRLAANASARGFTAEIGDLDSAVTNMMKDASIILITSSYEGEPPDNAARFVEWLQTCAAGSMKGIEFAVFGCGHKDWAKTFHRIPKLCDQYMGDCGGHRLSPMGLTDAAKGNMFGEFEDWLDDKLWPALLPTGQREVQDSVIDAEISTNARASGLRYDVSLATVKENRCLTAVGQPQKWHMEIQLPSNSTYECGDYLAILPFNPEKLVRQIMSHFELPWDAVITLKSPAVAIPVNTPLSVHNVLSSYVELAQPATKKDVKTCAQFAESDVDKAYLNKLADDPSCFEYEILQKRASVFDLLKQHPSIALPFAEFLSLLPPLRVRQYSISSTNLSNPSHCTITYGVISTPSHMDQETVFHGVAGTYLSTLQPGDRMHIAIKPTAKKTFRLPADPSNTPLLMFCAGTGLAPFRGFLQHRALQREANPSRPLAPAALFVGCRGPDLDALYADELARWSDVVDVHYAFSRAPVRSEGCKYVTDRMKRDKEDVKRLWREGARVYVCGSREFERGVSEAAREIVTEVLVARGVEDEAARNKFLEHFINEVVAERVASDVFD